MKKSAISFTLIIFFCNSTYSQVDQIQEIPQEVFSDYDRVKLDAINALKKRAPKAELLSIKNRLSEISDQFPNDTKALYYLGYLSSRIQSSDANGIPDMSWVETDKTSKYFERVISIDSRFDELDLQLDPYSKIGSEFGCLSLKYLYENKIDSARLAFGKGYRKNGFSTFNLNYCKFLLDRCPKNAILFTLSDIITFPTYYWQIAENYRPDVAIVDIGLLNTKWYHRLLTGYDKIEFKNIEIDLDTTYYTTWKSQEVQCPSGKLMVEPQFEKYLMKNNILLVNMLQNNNSNRPFVFCPTIDTKELEPFNDNLFFNGTFYEIDIENKKKNTKVVLDGGISHFTDYNYKKKSDESIITTLLNVFKNNPSVTGLMCEDLNKLPYTFVENQTEIGNYIKYIKSDFCK